LCADRDAELGALRNRAAQLVNVFKLLFPVMDRICARTCPLCSDPCCLHAKPWFDLRDLIFMHLAGLSIPLDQVLANASATCRCAGPSGCTLPRLSRPWICTWYICPAQKALLDLQPDSVRAAFLQRREELKEGRKRLEDEFIALVCSSPEDLE
jgi:hypothetical protein